MQSKLEGLANASGNLSKQKWLGKYYWDNEAGADEGNKSVRQGILTRQTCVLRRGHSEYRIHKKCETRQSKLGGLANKTLGKHNRLGKGYWDTRQRHLSLFA